MCRARIGGTDFGSNAVRPKRRGNEAQGAKATPTARRCRLGRPIARRRAWRELEAEPRHGLSEIAAWPRSGGYGRCTVALTGGRSTIWYCTNSLELVIRSALSGTIIPEGYETLVAEMHMSGCDTGWAVQVFEWRRERLVVSGRVHVANSDDGIARASELADLLGGAALLCLTPDGTRGSRLSIARTFGSVPESFAATAVGAGGVGRGNLMSPLPLSGE